MLKKKKGRIIEYTYIGIFPVLIRHNNLNEGYIKLILLIKTFKVLAYKLATVGIYSKSRDLNLNFELKVSQST